jgi:hypothetical protein
MQRDDIHNPQKKAPLVLQDLSAALCVSPTEKSKETPNVCITKPG